MVRFDSQNSPDPPVAQEQVEDLDHIPPLPHKHSPAPPTPNLFAPTVPHEQKPPRTGQVSKKGAEIIKEFNSQREARRAASNEPKRKTFTNKFNHSQPPVHEVIEDLDVPNPRAAFKKRSEGRKDSKKHYKPYNQNLLAEFGERRRLEEVKLNDKDFLKSQQKKLASISAAYGAAKASPVEKKPRRKPFLNE